ncbi:hypothetical protein BOTNAR_0570g00070 [Botryotinia narcissicola]|uniref:Uncharacterized protein n=1 Tax=Botryotinia narcissicola TaxID=278944 RepID=A0A4Z1HC85_9HELO|nr:hypothetical protein BOTNAR_0570g00070 [Botryotinia narcissicola]
MQSIIRRMTIGRIYGILLLRTIYNFVEPLINLPSTNIDSQPGFRDVWDGALLIVGSIIQFVKIVEIVESTIQLIAKVDQLAIQHSNTDVITSFRKLRHVVMAIRSRDSWPSMREEYHHSHDHKPIFYVKGGAAKFDNTRQRIKQHGRIHIALVKGDAERNCITLMGSTDFLPTEEFLHYLHATRSCTSLVGNTALLPTEEVPEYFEIGKTYSFFTWELFDGTDGFQLSFGKFPRDSFADLIEFNVWGNELYGDQEREKDNLQNSVYGAIAMKKHWFADNEARWQDIRRHMQNAISTTGKLCVPAEIQHCRAIIEGIEYASFFAQYPD